MYAIIETGGKQYWVVPGETLRVDKVEAEKGSKIELKALWAAGEGTDGEQGSRGATVKAEILGQVKGPKIIVFRKKAKSHYKKTRGHRQTLTEIRIESVTLN